MDLRVWLQQWLGIKDLHQRVVELETRIGSIETDVDSTLQQFGKYHSLTVEELTLVRKQLEDLLEGVSNVISTLENQAEKQRAARLKRRLRYNLTKLNNALASRIT